MSAMRIPSDSSSSPDSPTSTKRKFVLEHTLSSSYPSRSCLYQVPQTFRAPKLSSTRCGVCRRTQCTLTTHRRYEKRKQASAHREIVPPQPNLLQTSFSKSYVFGLCPPVTSDASLNFFRSLPIPDGESPDLQRSVWSFLTTFLEVTLAIPRPSNMTMNDIGGAILAMDSAIRAGTSQELQFLLQKALQYQQRSLKAMRENTAGGSLDAFNKENALSLCILWGKETAAGTPDTVRDYAQMVRSTIDSIGGLNALGQWDATAQAIMWVDMNTACYFEEDLWFKDIPPPTSPPAFFQTMLTQTTLPIAYVNALNDDVQLAALNFKTLLQAKESFTSNHSITMHEYRYLLDSINHNNMIRIGLENVYRNSNRLEESVTTTMNLLHLFTLFGSQGNKMTFEMMLRRIRGSTIRYGDVEIWNIKGHIDILMWICFVAAVTPMTDDHKAFFTSTLAEIMTIKYGNCWPLNWDLDTYAQLRTFLWLDMDLFDPFSKVCQAIDAHVSGSNVTYGPPIGDNDGLNFGTSNDPVLDRSFDLDGALFAA